MSKQTSDASKESTWRNHLARHAASGKSISVFCPAEAISESDFYAWCNRLSVASVMPAPRLPKLPTSFIDLGVVKDNTTDVSGPPHSVKWTAQVYPGAIES